MRPRDLLLLLLLTAGALLVHGYHPGVEDAEIYLPGVKKLLNPALYPFGSEFFSSHASLTLFPHIVARSIRLFHLPVDFALFFWQLLSIFALLLACWRIARQCFPNDERAPWGGVALVASLLTIPVAGTSLYILDQYLTARSFSTPAVMLAVACALERRFVRAGLWLVFAAAVHPLMAVFGASYLLVLFLLGNRQPAPAQALLLLPLGLFPPVTQAYQETLATRSYFFIRNWAWYEWLGVFGPLALLWWFSHLARSRALPVLARMSRALIVFALAFFALALALVPRRFQNLGELQPMRSLHLLYILLFAFGGGLLAKWVLRNRLWRWLLLFVPLCSGMWYAQRQLFPASRHIEWPGAAPRNQWVEAFDWIRQNTPPDAIFALDPYHMILPGEDQHGFRAIAERSMLADAVKDSGAVTMFPELAAEWKAQVVAQQGWRDFQAADFRRLKQSYGVSWVVLEHAVDGLPCPYQNFRVRVCRVE